MKTRRSHRGSTKVRQRTDQPVFRLRRISHIFKAEAPRAQSWKIARAKHVLSSKVEGTPRTQRKISSYLSELGGPFDLAQDMLGAFARDILSFSCGPGAVASVVNTSSQETWNHRKIGNIREIWRDEGWSGEKRDGTLFGFTSARYRLQTRREKNRKKERSSPLANG
jgi:hypothetical protein